MQARSKLKPGQKGTRKLVELYGSRLVCVRYRYDEQHRKRFKTVELIVAESPWTLPPIKPDKLIAVRHKLPGILTTGKTKMWPKVGQSLSSRRKDRGGIRCPGCTKWESSRKRAMASATDEAATREQSP